MPASGTRRYASQERMQADRSSTPPPHSIVGLPRAHIYTRLEANIMTYDAESAIMGAMLGALATIFSVYYTRAAIDIEYWAKRPLDIRSTSDESIASDTYARE